MHDCNPSATDTKVEALKRVRKHAGMSLQDVAKATGMLPQAIAKAERPGTDPRFSTVVRIAAALGVSVDSLAKDASRSSKGRLR